MKTSNEYAFSLFQLAREQKRVADYAACLTEINEVCEKNPEWVTMLASPAIPMEERLDLIHKAWSELEVKEVLYFLKLLCEKGQIQFLSHCIAEFFALKKESERHVAVEVLYASPLSEEQKARLTEKIKIQTGKIPDMVYREDPSLIGGIRVQIEDAVLDGSISAKLGTLKGVIKG